MIIMTQYHYQHRDTVFHHHVIELIHKYKNIISKYLN